MFRPSIEDKIVSIATGLIVLMVITSILSILLGAQVSRLLDELRLKSAKNVYGTRILASESVVASLGSEFESREIDRLLVAGQSRALSAFEIMGRNGEFTRASGRLCLLRHCWLHGDRERLSVGELRQITRAHATRASSDL
jgi:hypothetical protein